MATVTTTVVPVTCTNCCRDMALTVTTYNENLRHWTLDCPACGRHEDESFQMRQDLYVNEVDYLGSYWRPYHD